MHKNTLSRRKFLRASALAPALALASHPLIGSPAILKYYGEQGSLIKGVQLGTISYSFRSMKDQSAEATLQYILESGLSAVELMGGPAETFAGCPTNSVSMRDLWGLTRKQRDGKLSETEAEQLAEGRRQINAFNKEVANWRANTSLDKFKELRKMYQASGVKIYGYKPRAFGTENTDAEINFAMQAARALGASHVTVEHPSNDARTLKLGNMAKKNKIKIAYHGHEQQTPEFWNTALAQSKGNAMNPDMGHYIAAGNDQPLDLIRKHHRRISSMHLKDRTTPANGRKNLLWGKGDTPIGDILGLMEDNKYRFPATIELEYAIPEGSDAVKEVGRCLQFCRKRLLENKG
jgi:sugar phosphate isomerase/epimerase